tara:strand:+ start:1492 stop:2109 length:618 start_codon:yes stop_codon:yes gene_type:complete
VFQVNEVVQLNDTLCRVLLTSMRHIVWIAVEDKKAFPEIVELSQLEVLLLQEKLVRVEDPYGYIQNLLPEKGSKEARIRDTNYQIIKPLVEDPNFYIKKNRSQHIVEILAAGKVSRPYLYRLIRRYWQRGQTPNSLLPDYKNSGAKGQKRIAKDKKLGRPRVIMEGKGALVDEKAEHLFRIIIDTYVLNKSFSLAKAHRKLKGAL